MPDPTVIRVVAEFDVVEKLVPRLEEHVRQVSAGFPCSLVSFGAKAQESEKQGLVNPATKKKPGVVSRLTSALKGGQ